MTKAPYGCAYCGKPAHKRTTTVYVQEPGATPLTGNQFARHVVPDAYLTDKADCERYADGQVVSVSYTNPKSWGSEKPRHVHRFSEWDGVTWELGKGIFCDAGCATAFAYAAFNGGYRIRRAA